MSEQKPRAHDPDLLAWLWNNILLSWRLLFDRRVGGMLKLIPVAVVAYVLSPIDLLPDVFLPFGIVDDLGALLLGLQLFIHNAPPDIVEEYRQRSSRASRRGRFKPDDPKVIEGKYKVRDEGE